MTRCLEVEIHQPRAALEKAFEGARPDVDAPLPDLPGVTRADMIRLVIEHALAR